MECDGFIPWPEQLVRNQHDSPPAIECFAAIESCGIQVTACSEPVLLQTCLEGKRLLNFHITELWAQGIKDAFLFSLDVAWCGINELRIAFPWLPDWVWRNTWHQAMKGHELHSYDKMRLI